MKEAQTEKVSLAKLMEPEGEWSGPKDNEKFYNGTNPNNSPTGGALVVDRSSRWPTRMIKPRVLQPHSPNGAIDKTAVIDNSFSPESVESHTKINRLVDVSTGSENEFKLLHVRCTEDLHQKAKQKMEQKGGGYTTWEVAADMIEANRPVVRNASLQELDRTIEGQNRVMVEIVEEEVNEDGNHGKLIIVSARPKTDKEIGPPDDIYVDAMVTLLAEGFLNTDSEAVLAWMAHSSHEMLDNHTAEEIANRINSGDSEFARRGVVEFDASALHAHVRTNHQEPNPDFYAYFLNQEMGVLGPMLAVPTFSGPFRNGTYSKAHEMKQFVRPWFKTAGYQPAFHPMGSEEYLEEAHKNITQGAATSLTRAGITNDKSHAESRVRTEPFRTAERLYGSAHPLPEIEAAFVFSGVVNAAILSHYYESGVQGKIPTEAERFFSEPNELRFNINRLQIGAHGPFARIMDGNGEVTSYSEFIEDYSDFVEKQIQELGIETSTYVNKNGEQVDEVREFTDRLRRTVDVPAQGWSIENYMNPDHEDYAKGTLSTHLIAELAVEVTGNEQWRHSYQNEDGEWVNFNDYDGAKEWWHSVTRNIPEGRYEEEISDITDKLSDLTHKRFK